MKRKIRVSKPTLLPRVCVNCGRTFTGGPRARYCQSCRTERRREAEREFRARKRAGHVAELGSIIHCEICGKEIVKTSGLRRYCPECGAAHLKEVDNKQSLAWKRDNAKKAIAAKREFSRRRTATGERKESGHPGVYWNKENEKWQAHINLNGKQYKILYATNLELAVKARKAAEKMKKAGNLTIEAIEELRKTYQAINSEEERELEEKNNSL